MGLALWLHQLSKECSIIVWLGPQISRKSWNSISSLFCMSFPIFCNPCLHFPNLFPIKKKKHFPFIIIRHELCYPPIYDPLMKLSNVLFRKFLHLSLYLLSYEYMCKLSYVSLYMFRSIGSILIPKLYIAWLP